MKILAEMGGGMGGVYPKFWRVRVLGWESWRGEKSAKEETAKGWVCPWRSSFANNGLGPARIAVTRSPLFHPLPWRVSAGVV